MTEWSKALGKLLLCRRITNVRTPGSFGLFVRFVIRVFTRNQKYIFHALDGFMNFRSVCVHTAYNCPR